MKNEKRQPPVNSPFSILNSSFSFTQHVSELYACRLCPTVVGLPVTGPVAGARVMLVGQAPGPHEQDAGRPFAYTAGKRLFEWFDRIGVDEETFRRSVQISAVTRCFPGKDPGGGDRVPLPLEIANCSRFLDRELRLLTPGLIIAVGTLAAQQFLATAKLTELVGVLHKSVRAGKDADVVVLPHPSGRSTWLNRPAHALLLSQSLELIRQHPAFIASVATRTAS